MLFLNNFLKEKNLLFALNSLECSEVHLSAVQFTVCSVYCEAQMVFAPIYCWSEAMHVIRVLLDICQRDPWGAVACSPVLYLYVLHHQGRVFRKLYTVTYSGFRSHPSSLPLKLSAWLALLFQLNGKLENKAKTSCPPKLQYFNCLPHLNQTVSKRSFWLGFLHLARREATARVWQSEGLAAVQQDLRSATRMDFWKTDM